MDNDPLHAENAALRLQVEHLRRENTVLRQKLDALARRFFGKKSEQLDAAQLELLLGGLADGSLQVEESEEEEPPARREPRSAPAPSQRVRAPENLEVVRDVIEPEIVLAEPGPWKRIGEETSRLLDYQPGKFFWRETVRPKYVRTDDRSLPPVLAPAPARVGGGTLAAPGLLAEILVRKYADHLPFYRQNKIFERNHGVSIARQQMVQWAAQSERLLSGVYRLLLEQLRHSPYAQVDETPVKYLEPGHGQTKQGYLWTGLVPGQLVAYQWQPGRAAERLDELLGKNFAGRLQSDGYSAYGAWAKDKPAVVLFGCWAHCRRGFFEAVEQAPKTAGWILNQIGQLYRWERELRQSRAGPKRRQADRSSRARMAVERLHRALLRLRPRHLPQSPMGQAITHALNQWPALVRFLGHGDVEIDNNLVENAIRPTAVGKKNWLFFGSVEAGQRSAVIYTLVENCRMHGLDPRAYLEDLLRRLPNATNFDLAPATETFTPLRWQQARRAGLKKAA